jgi:hypothetical protein
VASAEQELTVLEGVDGVDPLDHRDENVENTGSADEPEAARSPSDRPGNRSHRVGQGLSATLIQHHGHHGDLL